MDISRVTIYKLVSEALSDEVYEKIKDNSMGSIRLGLSMDRTFYISTLGIDEDNYEGTFDNPFRTFKYAIEFIRFRVLRNNWKVSLQFLDEYSDDSLLDLHMIKDLENLTITSEFPVRLNSMVITNSKVTLENIEIDSSRLSPEYSALNGENSEISLNNVNLRVTNSTLNCQAGIYTSNSRVNLLTGITIQIDNEEKGDLGNKIILDNNSVFDCAEGSSITINGSVNSFITLNNHSQLTHADYLKTTLNGDGKRFELLRGSVIDTNGMSTGWIDGTENGEMDSSSQYY